LCELEALEEPVGPAVIAEPEHPNAPDRDQRCTAHLLVLLRDFLSTRGDR
jgi:hypothetical protein